MSPSTVEVPFPRGRTLRVLEHRARVHNFQEWERVAVEAVLDYLQPGMVVYDIGAEEGEFTALWAQVVGPDRVHIFEPTPSVWPNIRAVWQANFGDGSHANPGGTFQGFVHDGEARHFPAAVRANWPLCAFDDLQLDSRFSVVTERPDIGAVSVDRYVLEAPPPDVIFCDVEGAEVLVVAGAWNTLQCRRPEIFVSLHPPDFLTRFPVPQTFAQMLGPADHSSPPGCTQEHLFRSLELAGYRHRFISEDHEVHLRFTPVERW